MLVIKRGGARDIDALSSQRTPEWSIAPDGTQLARNRPLWLPDECRLRARGLLSNSTPQHSAPYAGSNWYRPSCRLFLLYMDAIEQRNARGSEFSKCVFCQQSRYRFLDQVTRRRAVSQRLQETCHRNRPAERKEHKGLMHKQHTSRRQVVERPLRETVALPSPERRKRTFASIALQQVPGMWRLPKEETLSE